MVSASISPGVGLRPAPRTDILPAYCREVGFVDDSANQNRDRGAIDAVVSWVDGSDPKHAAKRRAAMAGASLPSATSIPGGKDGTRFAATGEVEYCILGIRRHCPWIRTIHVVTDEQTPGFLTPERQRELGVRMVDHKHVFRGYEWALPVFNSRAIETTLHRIDGLAERFVYFNDDVFVLRDTGPEEFFEKDGVVLRGEWRALKTFGRMRTLISSLANHVALRLFGVVRSVAVLAQIRAAQLAGMKGRFLEAPHVPFPIRRDTLADFFARHPAVFEKNIGFRFRDMEQFVTAPLAQHLEIAAGRFRHSQAKDYVLICFNRDSAEAIERKISEVESSAPRFLCLQGLERATPSQRSRLHAVLMA